MTPTIADVTIPSTLIPAPSLASLYNPSASCLTSLFWICPKVCSGGTVSTTCQPRNIAVAPASTTSPSSANQAAQDLITYANSHYADGTRFVYFDSESSFLTYIESSDYTVNPALAVYSSAIVFNQGYPNWDYVVRLNRTVSRGVSYGTTAPDTSLPYVDLTLKSATAIPTTGSSNLPYAKAYLASDYFALVDAVDSFIATSTCRTSGLCSSSQNVNFTMSGLADFPNPYAVQSGFWSLIGYSFALVIIIGIMYPLANIISDLVKEKESKIREGMMMMALHGEALWASWIFHALAFFIPLAVILTIIGIKVFPYSSPQYIFVYFLLFFLSSISYCFFISVFFNSARTASILGNLIFLGGFFVYIGLQTAAPSRSQLLAACLHPSAAFTYGTLAFIEYEDASIGITKNTWNTSNEYSITFQDVLTMMFIDAIYLAVLAWYFSNIWPSEFGTHKPWYFIFLPNYWCSCFFKKRPITNNHFNDDDNNPNIENVPGNY